MKKIDILVPDLPESVADATVATWHKQPGDRVACDEVIVEIETDKVILEVPAPADGILETIEHSSGATVVSRQRLGCLTVGTVERESAVEKSQTISRTEPSFSERSAAIGPAARRLLAEHQLQEQQLSSIGGKGRLTSQDIGEHLQQMERATSPSKLSSQEQGVSNSPLMILNSRQPRREPMSRLRQRIAERLLEAKQSTAMLTTFNELNMQPIMQLRQEVGDTFEKQHGVRLGFMSFFIKAVVSALQQFPIIGASLDGNDMVYYPQIDISIAVSTPRGLVTPVLRDCETLSIAQIEKQIKELAQRGRDGKLTVEELTGGIFTITNGGLFGSLMSTPIINPPQSSILGMHAIKERPIAVNGQVVIAPMMYLALSYDHRLIDGQISVSFLVAIKQSLEMPIRLLLGI